MKDEAVSIKVEDKLYQNRYPVDAERPHIQIKDEAICASCTTRQCTVRCPAGC